jgi:glucose-1-phosphate thymidylyltransferase
MYLGDNLFERGIQPFVDAFRPDEGVNAVLALVRVEDPRAFGVAVVEDGRITRLVEKPADPPSDLAVAGVYVFDPSIHDAIEGLEPGAKGEYQITDAIARMIEAGRRSRRSRSTGGGRTPARPRTSSTPTGCCCSSGGAPAGRRRGVGDGRRRGRGAGRRRAPLHRVRPRR